MDILWRKFNIMTNLEKQRAYEIADKLGKNEILCQLSEECSELIQSCLKYRRATKGLTPKTIDETYKDLIEEIGDVLINIEQVLYLFREENIVNKTDSSISYKVNRWWHRTFISQK